VKVERCMKVCRLKGQSIHVQRYCFGKSISDADVTGLHDALMPQ
jgi:hypothetical protein